MTAKIWLKNPKTTKILKKLIKVIIMNWNKYSSTSILLNNIKIYLFSFKLYKSEKNLINLFNTRWKMFVRHIIWCIIKNWCKIFTRFYHFFWLKFFFWYSLFMMKIVWIIFKLWFKFIILEVFLNALSFDQTLRCFFFHFQSYFLIWHHI